MTNSFRVDHISFNNFNEVVEKAQSHIEAEKELLVDLSHIDECNSSAVCFLVDMQRRCNQKRCHLHLKIDQATSSQLKKLIALYGISDVFDLD